MTHEKSDMLFGNKIRKHLLFWLGIFLFFMLIQIPNQNLSIVQALLQGLAMFPAFIIATYSLTNFLLPDFLLKKKYLSFFILLSIWVLIVGFICDVLGLLNDIYFSSLFLGIHCDCSFDWETLWIRYTNSFYYFTFFVAFSASFIKLTERWQEKTLLQLRLEKEKTTSELQLLKAQLHPDFLFQTLDNLYSLTQQKSAQSPIVVIKFSHLLGYILYESQADKVALMKEIEIIQTYLDLEQLRFGNQLEVSLNFIGAIENTIIPPVLLFSFVENVFQYHFQEVSEETQWLSLDLSVKNSMLAFKLINSRINDDPLTESDILKNIKTRLNYLYADTYELKTITEDDIFIVSLRIPIVEKLQLNEN